MGRNVSLLLIDGTGALLGALPPFPAPLPWWQEAADVVAGARERWGVELALLRRLTSERPRPPGGGVTYLAQLDAAPAPHVIRTLEPVAPSLAALALSPASERAPWAIPGGPAASVAWARKTLDEIGRGELTSTVQQRTWNLSAVWRLSSQTPTGVVSTAWLKQVPSFFRHEAAVLCWLGRHAPGIAVPLLASDGSGRSLLEHVPGSDAYGCPAPERDRFATALHRAQSAAAGALDELLALGVPDRRDAALVAFIQRALRDHGGDTSGVAGLLATLPERLAAVLACNVPDTLVHGDFHPGNVRGDGERFAIIDWGDSFVGHPAFDALRLTDGCSPDDAAFLLREWCRRARQTWPSSDPERALALLRPVVPLRHAAQFASWLPQIEATERPYHCFDVAPCLADAATAWRASGADSIPVATSVRRMAPVTSDEVPGGEAPLNLAGSVSLRPGRGRRARSRRRALRRASCLRAWRGPLLRVRALRRPG
ncbi:MAG TPA: aminoglycoside phosphotransferase family protein [Polyangiaceae bacterium]|nr:aminoglycoside phosphotransferase family protein [Polyangiaceae bacterium]